MPAWWRDWRLYVLIATAILLTGAAYQVRLPAYVDIGALGDRAYLWASPLSADTGFNGDEYLAEEGLNYRWTKQASWVRFPDLAWNGPLRVNLHVRGARPSQMQVPSADPSGPPVSVKVNGAPVGRFEASTEWAIYTFDLSEYPGHSPDLEVLLETPAFSAPEDKRTLGVQWDWVRVDPLPGGTFPVLPPWPQLLLWSGSVALLYAGLRRWLRRWAFWAALTPAVLIPLGLAVIRTALTPYAWWALCAAGALFLLARADLILRGLRQWLRRGRSLAFFGTVVGVAVVVIVGYVRWALETAPTLAPTPDAALLVIFIGAAVLYAVLTLDRPLRRFFAWLDLQLQRPWLPAVLLALILAGVTIHEFNVIHDMQFIGHADYADNAVVARNLLAGRGFTVDYVTQFYQPYDSPSHPQETWPLLQPILIAPFFRFLGDSAFAAKLPNLVLQLALALLVYTIGTNLFDRRVGLVAATVTVLNKFIFRLIIFPTSDLAFTLFALLALTQYFRASEKERLGQFRLGHYIWAGAWAGLMMLAKPNGALYVAVALLVDLFWRWREYRWRHCWRAWLAFGIPAALLFAPWVLRNLVLFGAPVHSTERFDAWILKYQNWEEIYGVYFGDVPNRSWLLRYGFDRVTEAVGTEFRKWWQYLSVDSNALVTLGGSVLALVGLFVLRSKGSPDRGRAPMRLFSMVVAIFLLFGIFICTYWHVEERYFVPFIPWLALLAARGLWWVHDTLAYRRDLEGRPAPSGFGWLGLVLVIIICVQMTTPFAQESAAKMELDLNKRAELRAYAWLAENSQPDDIVMTRVPWQLTYYTERRSVMIPQDGADDAAGIADLYGVDYLFMDGDARGKRAALEQALHGDGPWEQVYNEEGIQIYRFQLSESPRRKHRGFLAFSHE